MTPIKLSLDLQRQEVIKHLLSLDREDLRLRFGYTPTDAIVEKYVTDTWNKDGHRWFGIYHPDYDGVVATIHVAQMEDDAAEFGFTVLKELRGHGLGDTLFKRGALWAKARCIKHVFMHCLSENKAVQHIARKNDMKVVSLGGGESEADVTLPTDYTALLNEVMVDRIAVYDMLAVNHQKMLSTLFRKIS